MSRARAPSFYILALALAGFVSAREARSAAALPVTDTPGKWITGGDGLPRILAPLADVLAPKQRSMIEGGFTTVSQVALKLPIESRDDDGGAREEALPIFYSLRCSVKFDAWEETFDVARLDDDPRTAVLKAFEDYGALCLTVDLDNQNLVARLAPSGGVIIAYLVVKQTSADEAAKIKDWLIQQQSGVMQGLFSHMLGELTLNQTIKVRITVPARPETAERDPRVKGEPRPAPAPKRKG